MSHTRDFVLQISENIRTGFWSNYLNTRILFGVQKKANTKYQILFDIEKIQIPNPNTTIRSNYSNSIWITSYSSHLAVHYTLHYTLNVTPKCCADLALFQRNTFLQASSAFLLNTMMFNVVYTLLYTVQYKIFTLYHKLYCTLYYTSYCVLYSTLYYTLFFDISVQRLILLEKVSSLPPAKYQVHY